MRSLTVFTIAAFMGLGALTPAQGQDEPEAVVEVVRPVMLLDIQPGDLGSTRQFFGQVVARQTVDLAFQVSGQIIRLPAEEGEVIPEGELVAELDLIPFQLQLEQAELQEEQAQRTFDRFSQLTLSVTEAQLEDSETDLALAGVAVRDAEFELENATLLAPFDALVATRNVDNFTTINQGSAVVRLHDMSELRIDIDVPEVLFQRASEDDAIRLEARFPTGPETYPLEVREFNAEATSVGQSFRITLALPNTDEVTALPGSSVTVIATLLESGGRFPIPATALRIANDGATSVMRFVGSDEGEGTVEEVPVDVEATRDGLMEVVAGLGAGDRIVRVGAYALQDGQAVRVFEGFPN